MRVLLVALALLVAAPAWAQMPAQTTPPEPTSPLPETNHYAIETPRGRMVVRLFDDTPLHRDNFKRLVQEAYYDSTTFHRVIEGFMIQGGDRNSLNDDPTDDGQGDPAYSVPAEFGHYHVRGALAAARQPDQINPLRASSGSQFYLVQGQPMSAAYLRQVRAHVRQTTHDATFDWPADVLARYDSLGGTPFLDAQYTVFGEVVEGLDVLETLSKTDTPRRHGDMSPWGDRPTERLWMVIRPVEGYTPPAPGAAPESGTAEG